MKRYNNKNNNNNNIYFLSGPFRRKGRRLEYYSRGPTDEDINFAFLMVDT